ncbi:MAG TPA: PRC-barrel domain-containing protein [Stellaceae bacterium]|nr:PRC-barrel domain-containing protein [Stellaceae bacterium]
MPKTTIAAIAAAVLSLAASAAQAQALSVPNPAPQARLLTVALTTQTGAMRASRLIGSTVYDVQNRNIGSVKDIVFDGEGKIQAVVIDVGAFLGVGGKYVAVNLDEIKADNDRLTLNRSKEQLQAARSYQLDNRQ